MLEGYYALEEGVEDGGAEEGAVAVCDVLARSNTVRARSIYKVPQDVPGCGVRE